MKLHIGKEIRRILEEKGITAKWLAQKINTSDRNLYDLLTRDEIGTGQLSEISIALGFDFFALYQRGLEGTGNKLEEPPLNYTTRKKITITIELDGSEEKLDECYKTLKRVNAAL